MIAILQFDAVNLPHLHQCLEQGRLPTLAQLRGRGHWYALETPTVPWEGATYFTLYSGRAVAEHGLYFHLCGQQQTSGSEYKMTFPLLNRFGIELVIADDVPSL